MNAPKEIFLKDYKMPDYYFDSVDLKFSLGEENTVVCSKISVYPRIEGCSSPLVLDGKDLKLVSIKVNSKELKEEDFLLDSRHLTLLSPPIGKFTLEIVTEIYPQKNTSLEGLYKTSQNFCTQCEAEGFRKITFYQDRPDIMAKYNCRIEADKSLYPVILSNGNLTEQGDLEGGRHYAIWEDPFKKPCYLFALVAGQLKSRDDTFTTRSGRKSLLRIWTPEADLPKTEHAMYSLKAAMKWDEDVFGLEYDLDLFNIVAVPDFNMGAMENKSLNIFNSRLVLASPETASDADYAAILGVIGHEYFHNWTGNRVTCRDWFQLSLKEGLTVFRDQEFSSDMGSRTVKRIGDVSKLRNYQFPQDAGPMAHPVRPHSYIKMDNFYTVTVYEKGAEVVRMYKTLLGSQGFRKGMDLYFKRHDGQAVTCEDFFAAMRDANDAEFFNFLVWYSQAGTPLVKVVSNYNAEAKSYSLKFSQEVPPTPGQPMKEPMFIPVAVGLLDSRGKDMPISSLYHHGKLESIASNDQPVYTTVLRVTKKEEEFVFLDVPEQPIPSLLRGYSAPIRLDSDLSESDLFFLLANDSDEFNRWEAGQILARKLMLSLVANFQQSKPLVLNPQFVRGVKSILCDPSLDKEFIAKAITLPGEGEIMDMMEVADPDAVHAVRSYIKKQLASALKEEFLSTVKNNRSSEQYKFNHPAMARRALKNVALAYLASLGDPELTELALQEYRNATNMTEQFAALAAIAQIPGKTRDDVLADFYSKWQNDYLVVNKWFALQAMSDISGNVENVQNLINHPAFDLRNPNKVYSLIGGFCGSPVNFHAKDGSGYRFLGEMVVQLDKLNPQRRRWGRFLSIYWCFGSQKHNKRIGHAVLVPETTAPGAVVPASENQPQAPPSIALPFIAPPSSPASFLQSEPPSAAQSPVGLLSITSISASMYSPGGPANIFAIGPYSHETQLVSPPVFSTYTTEPSTAPFTPPPELTTPSSPEVPFARLLDPNNQNGEAGHKFISSQYEFKSYQLYPGSPVGQLISPGSVISGSGTSSPFPDGEFAPGQPHFLEFRSGEPPKILNLDKLSHIQWGSQQGSGSLTPDAVRPRSRDSFLVVRENSDVAPLTNSCNGCRNEETVVDHRVSFEITAEHVIRCVEKKPVALPKAVLASIENAEHDSGRVKNLGDMADSHVIRAGEISDDTPENASGVGEDGQRHQKHRSLTLGSIKEFNFDNVDGIHSDKPNTGSKWWANEKVLGKEEGEHGKNWSFFPMLQPSVS